MKRKIKRKDFSPDSSILLFSDPRGGSTWLAETLASIPSSFIYWEPLALNYVSEVKNLGFGWRQYIPSHIVWPEAKMIFDKILSAKIVNEWTTKKIKDERLVKEGEVPIIKICRGNHLLEWLVHQYDFKYKPIYLVRHPLAVVASQLKQGGWNYAYNGFHIPEMKFNEEYKKHENFLKGLMTKAEALLATWSITNKNLLEKEGDKWIKVYYEELVLNPHKTIHDIFSDLGIEKPENIENRLNKWSSTTIGEGTDSPNKQLQKWTNDFSPSEMNRFQEILDYFKIKTYHVQDVLPNKSLRID